MRNSERRFDWPEDVVACLLPDQRPGRWLPGTPIHVLPLLQLAYPGCIDEDLVSIELHNAAFPQAVSWVLRCIRLDDVVEVPCSAWGAAEGLHADEVQQGPLDHPALLIRDLVAPRSIKLLQEAVGVLRPASFALFMRIWDDAEDAAGQAHDAERRQLVDRLVFYRDSLQEVAAHHASLDMLASTVESALRAMPAFGVRDGALATRWEEVCDEAAQPSLLAQQTRDDVEGLVAQTFASLPRGAQLALWVASGVDELPGESDPYGWEPPGVECQGRPDFWELHRLYEQVTRIVMARAERDGESRRDF